MLNLQLNKLCKLKSKWQYGKDGKGDNWILIYPTHIKVDENAPFGLVLTIKHEFCLTHLYEDLNFRFDDVLSLIDNGDWILDKPTAENMFFF
jgi:hypothetical protein